MTGERTPRALYLAEEFVPRGGPTGEESAWRLADQAGRTGGRVLLLETIIVLAEETVLHLVEAVDADAVDRVLRAAGLEAERISPVILKRPDAAVAESGPHGGECSC